jgi:TldD protein
MSNLLLAAGDDDPESLIHAAGAGLYVKMIGNGAVTPVMDTFSFEVLEGHVIEGGRIGPPVSRLCISGRPSEMLKRIRGIGRDVQLDLGRGVCMKSGQAIPVSVGMPSILVDRMSVRPCI